MATHAVVDLVDDGGNGGERGDEEGECGLEQCPVGAGDERVGNVVVGYLGEFDDADEAYNAAAV